MLLISYGGISMDVKCDIILIVRLLGYSMMLFGGLLIGLFYFSSYNSYLFVATILATVVLVNVFLMRGYSEIGKGVLLTTLVTFAVLCIAIKLSFYYSTSIVIDLSGWIVFFGIIAYFISSIAVSYELGKLSHLIKKSLEMHLLLIFLIIIVSVINLDARHSFSLVPPGYLLVIIVGISLFFASFVWIDVDKSPQQTIEPKEYLKKRDFGKKVISLSLLLMVLGFLFSYLFSLLYSDSYLGVSLQDKGSISLLLLLFIVPIFIISRYYSPS